MKNLNIELPLQVQTSFIQYFDGLDEKSYQDYEQLNHSMSPDSSEPQKWSYPMFTLDTDALHNKELKVQGGFWLLYNLDEQVFSEFDQEGKLVKFYPANESTREMVTLLNEPYSKSKNIKAILSITPLNLNFCWFGDTIPEPGPTDTFVLFGYCIPAFEKGKKYNLSTFLHVSLTELEKLEAATPSSFNGIE